MAVDEIALAKNQQDISPRANELDVSGEARLYRALRHFWHPVVFSREVSDKPVPVTLCEQKLVVVRLDGEVERLQRPVCAPRDRPLTRQDRE